MLVLTRRIRECVIMTTPDGTEMILQVLGVAGGQVRLGFEAPKTVRIERDDMRRRSPREGGTHE